MVFGGILSDIVLDFHPMIVRCAPDFLFLFHSAVHIFPSTRLSIYKTKTEVIQERTKQYLCPHLFYTSFIKCIFNFAIFSFDLKMCTWFLIFLYCLAKAHIL